MAGPIERLVQAGEPHVVVADRSGRDGRKGYGISAVYSTSEELLAKAWAT